MMQNLTLDDIPVFLRDSGLCENIKSDDTFQVPIELFKKEIIINTFEELIEYIKIFDYWIINKIPDEFYDWIFGNKDKINMELLNELFPMNDLIKQIQIMIDTLDNNICYVAAGNGYLDLLKYAHNHSYFWDKLTCYYASEKNHLECLKYAYENGCPGPYGTKKQLVMLQKINKLSV